MDPIGVDVVTSIARRWVLPEVVDNIYASNPVFFRVNQANKRIVRGGTHIEVPLMHQEFAAGGPYSGFDVLDTAPSDTVRNARYDWRQHFVPVTVDGLTLIKTDSPEAIANFIQLYFAQAEMQMSENLGFGLWSDGSAAKEIDGFETAVDDGTVTASYAGLNRTTFSFWNSQVDSTTATLDKDSLQSMHGSTGTGGRHATLIASRQEQYNRYWSLNVGQQRYPAQPMGHDEQLASAGFDNLLFNNTPWVVDSHVFDGPNTSNSAIVFLNEDFMYWAVSPRADFYLEDFQSPVNQDAMVSKLLWAGNLVFTNLATQGKMTAVAA